jgi:hypothetical protein
MTIDDTIPFDIPPNLSISIPAWNDRCDHVPRGSPSFDPS